MNRTDFEIQHTRDTYLKDVELHHHDFFEVFFLISEGKNFDLVYQFRFTVFDLFDHIDPAD